MCLGDGQVESYPVKGSYRAQAGAHAAVVSTKISSFRQKELSYEDITEVFWTDSKVVLGYISMKQGVFIHLLLTECKKYATMPPPISGATLTPKRTELTTPQEV